MPLAPRHRESPALKRVILAGAILCYLGGYGAVRMDHFLVHTKSFAGSMDVEGPTVASHGIAPGDFGTPTLGLATTFATLVAGLIYWPMTTAELSYWYIVEPTGSPYDGPVPPPPDPKSFPPPPTPAATLR